MEGLAHAMVTFSFDKDFRVGIDPCGGGHQIRFVGGFDRAVVTLTDSQLEMLEQAMAAYRENKNAPTVVKTVRAIA